MKSVPPTASATLLVTTAALAKASAGVGSDVAMDEGTRSGGATDAPVSTRYR
jgi:hypothetical protein